jgi:multisubunit Na+/H+ antiporter MnhF subunit
MNEWLLAATALTAGIVPLAIVSARANLVEALVAVEFAGPVGAVALLLIAEGTHRQGFADLAIVAAVASLAGSLAFARFLERRL